MLYTFIDFLNNNGSWRDSDNFKTFELFYTHGYSSDHVAEIMNISERTVFTRIESINKVFALFLYESLDAYCKLKRYDFTEKSIRPYLKPFVELLQKCEEI
jgi:predicted DNA-binding protein YlxM (UPF0122 family)